MMSDNSLHLPWSILFSPTYWPDSLDLLWCKSQSSVETSSGISTVHHGCMTIIIMSLLYPLPLPDLKMLCRTCKYDILVNYNRSDRLCAQPWLILPNIMLSTPVDVEEGVQGHEDGPKVLSLILFLPNPSLKGMGVTSNIWLKQARRPGQASRDVTVEDGNDKLTVADTATPEQGKVRQLHGKSIRPINL